MKIFKDLYRDLRDKKLLPVVAILIAAIVAVPLLLGGGDPEPVAPTADSSAVGAGADDAPEARAVVVQQPPSIREFDKRLDSFQRKNPFKQQLTGPTKKQQQAQNGTLEDTSADGGGGGGGAESADGTGGGNSGGGGDSGGNGGTETEEFLITYQIDVKVGVAGDTEKKKGVKQFSFLPGVKRPVVQFITGEGNEAFFVVSRNVGKTSGDGACAPSNKTCSFLLLKKGEEHKFVYQPDGRTYRLKLTNVKRIVTEVGSGEAAGEAKKAFDSLRGP